jgi:hypothetical protein
MPSHRLDGIVGCSTSMWGFPSPFVIAEEIFVGGGRAQLVTGEFAEMGHTSVHMLATGPKPVRLDNYSIYSMGCGWIGG